MPTPPTKPDEGRTPKGTTTQPGFLAPIPLPPAIPDHELLELIGRGSYGQVWLARSRLATLRAVKIVSREAFEDRKPFEREFKGIQRFEPVSRTHEGLVDILQVGVTDDYFYYVMELADDCQERQKAEGRRQNEVSPPGNQSNSSFILHPSYFPKTLRAEQQRLGRLPVADCVRIGRLLVSALAHLHRHNLVHRDVKPSNIIFVEGQPKLADIGLVADLSEARSYVGTEGFVPPEGPGTPKADLYSLGKVLYEISTGNDRRDFPAWPDEFALGTDAAKAQGDTTSPSAKGNPRSAGDSVAFLELNAVIIKACQADPEQRYASAEAMEVDLALLEQGRSVKRRHAATRRLGLVRKYGTATLAICLLVAGGWLLSSRFGVPRTQPVDAPSAPEPSSIEARTIAVLPFDNEISDEADKNLGAQIAEELRNRLKRISGLRVLEWDSAVALKKAKDPLAAARQIKLNPVVTGKVRGAGDRLQLTVQLVNTANGRPLWSAESVDRNRAEMLSLPKELAEQIAGALNLELTEIALQQAAVKPTLDPAAQDLYWLGRRYWRTWTASGMEKAIACFEQAIQKDPNYAQAYAGLADCYISGLGPAAGGNQKARENAEKAMQLGPNVSEAHASQGYILEIGEDWKGAETAFKRALELDPNNATAHYWYGIHLARMGQYEAGIQEARLAQELDPLSSGKSRALCWVLTAARQYDAAIEQFENNLRLPPSKAERGDCYFYKGLYEEGIAALQKAAISHGEDPEKVAQHYDSLREAYLKSGPKGYWQRELELAQAGASPREGNEPMNLAVIYAWLGDKEQTIAWLEKSGGGRRNVNMTPVFDLVRSDPRYQALLKQAGLPEPVWK